MKRALVLAAAGFLALIILLIVHFWIARHGGFRTPFG
jgi:hypothetical protein